MLNLFVTSNDERKKMKKKKKIGKQKAHVSMNRFNLKHKHLVTFNLTCRLRINFYRITFALLLFCLFLLFLLSFFVISEWEKRIKRRKKKVLIILLVLLQKKIYFNPN